MFADLRAWVPIPSAESIASLYQKEVSAVAFRSPVYDEVREQVSLAEYAADVLEVRSHYYNGDPCTCVCPVCGSGEGPNGTAALTLSPSDPLRWYCFAHGKGGDIFDLAGAVNGTDNIHEQLALVAEWARLDLDGLRRPTLQARMQMAYNRQKRKQERERKQQELEKHWQIGREVEAEWLHNVTSRPLAKPALDYLASRGIDEQTANRWRLGYDARAERIVIPYVGSDYYHADRDITGSKWRHKYDKPRLGDVGPEPMWNPGALESDVVVMVEGQFDALAVGEAGFAAVACGGVGTAPTLAEIRSRGGYDGMVLLMQDNDEIGHKAAMSALEQFGSLCSVAVFHEWPEGIKDPFEYWQADPQGLMLALNRAVI